MSKPSLALLAMLALFAGPSSAETSAWSGRCASSGSFWKSVTFGVAEGSTQAEVFDVKMAPGVDPHAGGCGGAPWPSPWEAADAFAEAVSGDPADPGAGAVKVLFRSVDSVSAELYDAQGNLMSACRAERTR